ncbi:hypothetical protein [Bacillus alkalicellulosilyticus]|uniref:hypothetical protein n=1 Tax=Alkalihalobacterium alkalicellulosilyticum TaxID=1912214 RepID=UPI0009971710|nr:hypothetical protein [Bacillus alkalicellulosilyticus]
MKKCKAKVLCIYFIVMAMVIVSFAKPGEAKTMEKATWLWDTYEIVHHQADVVAFLIEQGATTVYLQINRDIPMNHYRAFIQRANSVNIKVHALDGAPSWASKNGKRQYQPLLDWLRTYQQQAHQNEKFTGIHIDVEPYLLADWTRSQQRTIEFFQEVVIDFRVLSSQLSIEFGVDLPFWFDEVSFSNKTYGKGILSNWVIDQSDVVTLMAYRNFAEGPNGIIELVRNEMTYASIKGKSIVVGVETMASNEGSHISFFEQKHKLNTELAKVTQAYANSASFKGVAVHHYSSWKQLMK